MLQLYIKKIEYRVRASIFLYQSAVSPSVPLWARIQTLLSNLLQTRLLASHSLSSFFYRKKSSSLQRWWGLTVRIAFLFILLHRQDLILRRILGLRRVLPTTGNRGPKTISSTTWTRPIMCDPTREMQKNMPSGQAPAQNYRILTIGTHCTSS